MEALDSIKGLAPGCQCMRRRRFERASKPRLVAEVGGLGTPGGHAERLGEPWREALGRQRFVLEAVRSR